jgi:hypothetical protein
LVGRSSRIRPGRFVLHRPNAQPRRHCKHQTEAAHSAESQTLKYRPVTLPVIRKDRQKENKPYDAAEPGQLAGQQHQTQTGHDHCGKQSYSVNSGVRHFIFSMSERALAILAAC